MELDSIGTIAVRNLASDLANLMARTAVLAGVIEDLVIRERQFNVAQWKNDDEADTLEIPGDDRDRLFAMLHLIRSMQ